MTTYLIVRHKGAVDWAARRGIKGDWIKHLSDDEMNAIGAGDRVYGTLPVQIVAEINRRGARYFQIEMNLREEDRGRELSADEMEDYEAAPVEYRAERVEG